MPQTFHQFGELPPELRLRIWEMAIRPHKQHRRKCCLLRSSHSSINFRVLLDMGSGKGVSI